MFIRSERLFLRPGWPEDWNELLGQVADEAAVRNLASAPWPYTAAAVRDYAARSEAPRYPLFMITLPTGDGSRIIGATGLTPVAGASELGYWIAQEQWNRGYATEAVRAMIRMARTLGHRRLVAYYFVDNPQSGRVLHKAGFATTGETGLRYSLSRGEEALAEILALELGAPSACDGARVDLGNGAVQAA